MTTPTSSIQHPQKGTVKNENINCRQTSPETGAQTARCASQKTHRIIKKCICFRLPQYRAKRSGFVEYTVRKQSKCQKCTANVQCTMHHKNNVLKRENADVAQQQQHISSFKDLTFSSLSNLKIQATKL